MTIGTDKVTQAMPTPPVLEAVESVDRVIDRLFEQMDSLESRLVPVLQESNVPTSGQDIGISSPAPLAGRLNSSALRLRMISDRLADLLERLAV